MNRSDRLEVRHLAVAALLVAVFMAQSLAASRQKSPVFDEPPHIASGLSYVDTHTFNANRQHPPLLKELSALALKMAGVHWPHTADAETVVRGGPTAEERVWSVGVDIIAGGNVDRTLFWARLPFVLLGALLGALIYLWGRDLVGPTPALGGLLLFAFDPTILAHTALVTTDVGVTTFVVLFLFTLWRYLQHPSWPRVVWCGLALGGALGAKFSAIFLVPTAAILLFVTRERRTAPAEVAVPKTGAVKCALRPRAKRGVCSCCNARRHSHRPRPSL